MAHCFHDGRPVRVDQVVHGQGKISVVINGALRKNAGFYYCKSKYGVFSPWIKLQLKGRFIVIIYINGIYDWHFHRVALRPLEFQLEFRS